ncbi:MAG TPA: hypothetical protein VGM92_08760, partial [Candidatus Kapabacteria bacterium]
DTQRISKSSDDTTKTVTKQNQVGDPRWGERIEWCIKKRCELLGLDKIDQIISETAYTFAEQVQANLRSMKEATLGNTSVNEEGVIVPNNDTTMDNNQRG